MKPLEHQRPVAKMGEDTGCDREMFTHHVPFCQIEFREQDADVLVSTTLPRFCSFMVNLFITLS